MNAENIEHLEVTRIEGANFGDSGRMPSHGNERIQQAFSTQLIIRQPLQPEFIYSIIRSQQSDFARFAPKCSPLQRF
jgi:hypothetical protein